MTKLQAATENLLVVGSREPLHGLITVPSEWSDIAPAERTVFVGLNSGLLHHVGGSNLTVELCRGAAAHGILAARYDASGIGDSPARQSAEDHQRRTVNEALEVIDHLATSHEAQRFVLFGLCSGAFTSFNAALEDDRVRGVVQIAGFAYPNTRWRLNHLKARAFKREAWRSRWARMLGRRVDWRELLEEGYLDPTATAGWTIPPQSQVAEGYEKLCQQKVSLLNIMTGGEAYYYNYAGQYKDLFPVLKRTDFEEHLFSTATHVLAEPVERKNAQALILNWLKQRFSQEH